MFGLVNCQKSAVYIPLGIINGPIFVNTRTNGLGMVRRLVGLLSEEKQTTMPRLYWDNEEKRNNVQRNHSLAVH